MIYSVDCPSSISSCSGILTEHKIEMVAHKLNQALVLILTVFALKKKKKGPLFLQRDCEVIDPIMKEILTFCQNETKIYSMLKALNDSSTNVE